MNVKLCQMRKKITINQLKKNSDDDDNWTSTGQKY